MITIERLRKFNDQRGTVAGNAMEELEAKEVKFNDENPQQDDGQVCEDDAVVEDIVDQEGEERDEKISQAISGLSIASR